MHILNNHTMKKILIPVATTTILLSLAIFSTTHAAIEPATPPGYQALTWVKEPGITSFINVPDTVGYIDYITIIDLTKNQIRLMSTSTPRVYEGPAVAPFSDETTKNWLFTRDMVESLKAGNPQAKFIWNAPFFNVTMSTTILSLGLKSSDTEGTYISSGGRPQNDMEQARRMLIIDNTTGKGTITDFNEVIFVQEGDQAVEGFHPLGSPSSKAEQAARVYLGIKNDGKELVVYCSRSASKEEASNALTNAGVPQEQQMQVDGGGSATCGYNLPGQYFVEPGRALSHIMGAIPVLPKGTITINNLNVRSGPGVKNSIVKKLPIGSVITIQEERDGWIRIADTEWVSGQYVQKIKTLPYTAKVTIEGLNVRTGAGVSFAPSRKLTLGTMVSVQEEKNGWARISENEWISAKYIQ